LIILARSSRRSASNVYFALVDRFRSATASSSCVFFASRCWSDETFCCSSKSPIHSRPFNSPACGSDCVLSCAKSPPGCGRILYSFSRISTSFSERRTDGKEGQADTPSDKNMDPYFESSYAKLGTSSCKKCKEKIEKGALRLAKVRYVLESHSHHVYKHRSLCNY